MNMKPQTQSAGLGCCLSDVRLPVEPADTHFCQASSLSLSWHAEQTTRQHKSGRNLNVRLLTMVAKMSVSAVVVVRMCLHVCPLTMFATGIHLLVSD